jgi:hypothetical protein
MALHGSVSSNLSPLLFKGNNRSLGVNVIIHQDESGSMDDLIQFYGNGTFIGSLQDALLAEKIGDDITRYPNLYSYFGVYSRNPSTAFTISNSNGSLSVNQAFMKGEATRSATISKWTGTNYFTNPTTHVVNICTDVIGNTTGGRLSGFGNEVGGGSPKSEDVHGSLWSVFTTPNAISSGTPGRFGSVIGSNVRRGSTTIIITNSDEQGSAPTQMLNQLVAVNSAGTQERTINGSTGELVARNYRVIALSSYTSTDGYDGVLFYGSKSTQPYGYVDFTSVGIGYTITRSATAPNWIKSSQQLHDTLSLASETRGGLFKIRNVFGTTDNRVGFSSCLAAFIADTV